MSKPIQVRPFHRLVATAGVVAGAIILGGCAGPAPSPEASGSAAQQATPTTHSTPRPATYVSEKARLGIGNCALFPRDNAFHATVSALPRRSDSSAVISAMGGTSLKVRPAFSAGIWEGSRSGIPINVVDSAIAKVIDFVGGTYAYLSELENHPIPDNPRFEGWPGIAWDRHLLIVDTRTCSSSEFFHVTPPWNDPKGRWVTETAVKIDLRSNTPEHEGTATASGTSILSGLVRFDEVRSGAINHVIGVSVPAIKKGDPLWPATQSDGKSTNPNAPSMGTWLRLKASIDVSRLGPQARVVADALKKHGAVIVDTNKSGIALSGEPDERWDDEDLSGLEALSAADFEVVDPTPMIVSPSSHQIR